MDINEDYTDLPEADTSVIARKGPHPGPTRSDPAGSLLRVVARELARAVGGGWLMEVLLHAITENSTRIAVIAVYC